MFRKMYKLNTPYSKRYETFLKNGSIQKESECNRMKQDVYDETRFHVSNKLHKCNFKI